MASLQEQLLKAGLADEKKARAVRNEKRKQRKQQPKGAAVVNETEERARKAREEKAERDRQLNLERQREAEKKAIKAQIRQLIETNRLDRSRGEASYQFVDGKKIKKILVDDTMVDQLSRGRLAIVALGDSYEVVPDKVARKIMERDESAVVSLHERKQDDAGEDDPYAGYEIPDDLMW
ncbi:MAG: nucleoprotein/polynucleotide-associated enzyme [Marinobacter sp. 34-60-7]|nr:MAG: nucleoprotein/polynucleotide-associated enzyme [Marinobacter sp. 34-60-7]